MADNEEEQTAADRNFDQASDANKSNGENNDAEVVPLYRFVMTGGPCGGKTTALARVFSFLRERGFEVINCPEAFTLLRSNGMSVDFFSTPGIDFYIQGAVLDTQTTLEDGVARVLQARGNPGVILCDRGTMDGTVYMEATKFEKLCQDRDTDLVQLRDNRYDAIFHLVTAADGAEQHYTLENNRARTETPQQAIQVDRKTQQAWVGHPHLYVLDNSTDFEGKMNRLVDIISKIVGLPSQLQRRSAKFLLKQGAVPPFMENLAQVFPPDVDYQVFEVEKVYLLQQPRPDEVDKSAAAKKRENYSFIRRRTNVDKATGKLLGSVYQLTTVHLTKAAASAASTGTTTDDDDDQQVIEQKRIISEREYNAAYLSRDARRHVVKQRRVSFLYKHQSFCLHMYQRPVSASGLCILHAQVEASRKNNNNNGADAAASADNAAAAPDGEPQVDLPSFLDVERRLSNTKEDERLYGAYSLSLI